MKKPNYRLNTDEVEKLVKEETERRRKLRIVQVREQAKAHAALIRNKVKSEKDRLLTQFANEVKSELEDGKAEKVRKLEQKYDNTLRTVGQGHREVAIQGDGQNLAFQRLRQQESDHNAADQRFRVAIEKQAKVKAVQDWEDNRHIRQRNLALEMEKERAAVIASLPPPPPDISAELEKVQKKAIPLTDMKAFSTTHFHIPDYQVVKARPEEQIYDAKQLAQDSDLRLKQDLAEKKRSQHEQIEKARIRGNEALQREMLKHDLGDMLQDLSLLQKKDRRRRQGLVADIPKQVFIPPERCMEERADREVEMERKFEEMYLKQHKSDSTSSQAWSELPSTAQESTITSSDLESAPIAAVPLGKEINPALRDVTNLAKTGTGKEPDSVLKQLLERIKEQRNSATAVHRIPNAASHVAGSARSRDGDTHSVLSAGSRASWKKSDQHLDSGGRLPSSANREDVLAATTPGREEGDQTTKESSSGLDGVTLSKTNGMIDELQQRIKMIEDQKKQLSEQLQSQTEFYKKFQHLQQRQEQYSNDASGVNGDLSLEEVSLTGSEKRRLNPSQANLAASKRSPVIRDGVITAPEESPSLDLSSARSNLKPVFGIFKGQMNPNFDLLTSNGFLPLPEMNRGDGSTALQDNARSLQQPPSDSERRIAGEASVNDEDTSRVFEKGARRMINFRDPASGNVHGPSVSFGTSQILGGPAKSLGYSELSMMNRSGNGNESRVFDLNNTATSQDSTSGGRRNVNDGMGRRMKQYEMRAQSLQESLDEDTLARVREYQNRLLQTHEDRKEFLSNVRADIERRREALYNTARSSAAPLAGLDSGVAGIGVVPLTSSLLNQQGSALTASGGGAGASYADSRYSNLKPIAPFIADSWMGRSSTLNRQGVMPSGDGGGRDGDLMSEYMGGPSGVGVDSHDSRLPIRSDGGDAARRSPALDRIRKSLPFDDLNDSTFDPAANADLSDTAASKRSHAFSEGDDSKFMLSSEEDRGSPILTGSRSDRFDASDKSTNYSGITGSSSLNGSILVARAEERREGFERRQEELKQQLMEIQDQKEAILDRYYQGQQALSQQQEALRTKLASTSSSSAFASQSIAVPEDDDDNDSSEQRSDLREKLSSIRSQVQSENVGNEDMGQDGGGGRDGADHPTGARLISTLPFDSPRQFTASTTSWLDQLKPYQREASGSSGGAGSAQSGQTRNSSFGLSANSYLDDISYHQIKGTDESLASGQYPAVSHQRLTASAPMTAMGSGNVEDAQSRYAGDAFDGRSTRLSETDHLGAVAQKTRAVGEDSQSSGSMLKTWASLLQPNTGHDNLASSTQSSLDLYKTLQQPQQPQQQHQTTATAASRQGAYEHQAHELSTILEVDTPSVSSVRGSNLSVYNKADPNSSASLSNASLTHIGGGGSTVSLPARFDSSETRIDRFVDLPYTLPAASSLSIAELGVMGGRTVKTYDLSSGAQLRGPAASLSDESRKVADGGCSKDKRGEISLSETSRAARSLHFHHPPEIEVRGFEEFVEPRAFQAGQRSSPSSSVGSSPTPGGDEGKGQGIDTSCLQERSLSGIGMMESYDADDVGVGGDGVDDYSLESQSLSPDQADIAEYRAMLQSVLSDASSNGKEVSVDVDEEGAEELSSLTVPHDLVGLTPIKPHYEDGSAIGGGGGDVDK